MLKIKIKKVDVKGGCTEIYARAWKNGVQIGFGRDGTVDIERFRYFNLPELVEDPCGEIAVYIKGNSVLKLPGQIIRYTKNKERAMMRALEDTILSMVNIHDASKIIKGKRGNTTTTVYADPSAYMFNTNANWATLRADGTSVGYDTTSSIEAVFISGKITNYNAGRNIYHFDTSGIPDTDVISAATFSVKFTGSGSNAESTHPANGALVGVTGTPDENTSDYGKINETRYADTDVLIEDVYNTAGYADWSMNATGVAAINKSGDTYLGIRGSNAFSDATTPTARSYAMGYFAAASGTTNDPKLVIEHAAGGNTPPTLDTTAADDITRVSATANGNITDTGGENADERGFVYGTSSQSDPGDTAPASSAYDSYISTSGDYGAGVYDGALTSLSDDQTYYVRAYAHNSEGYAYGDEVTFDTLAYTAPEVTTGAATNVAETTATFNGNITDTGGVNLDHRGFVYGTSSQSDPGNVAPASAGYDHYYTTSGDFGTGVFDQASTGLTENTTYYVRAYGQNTEGYTYGDEGEFTTDTYPRAIAGAVTLNASPVSGATVRCIRQSDNVALTAQTTDSTGAYTFTGLDAAELYHVMVEYEDGGTLYNAKSLWDIVPYVVT